jgi:hypothetical protein
MRTTITLDADVAAKLKAESKKTGRPFKVVVNEYLRLGFTGRQQLRTQCFQGKGTTFRPQDRHQY